MQQGLPGAKLNSGSDALAELFMAGLSEKVPRFGHPVCSGGGAVKVDDDALTTQNQTDGGGGVGQCQQVHNHGIRSRRILFLLLGGHSSFLSSTQESGGFAA
jgi:hypothetical protein